MKLLKVIIVLSSLLFWPAMAEDKNPKEMDGAIEKMPMPVFLGEDIRYSEMGFFFTAVNYMKFRLNKTEKHLHKSAVFFMLDNAENGFANILSSKLVNTAMIVPSPSVKNLSLIHI